MARVFRKFLMSVWLLSFLALGSQAEEKLKLRIEASDNLPASVSVEGQLLGQTGETLLLDITGYRDPLLLNVILSRPGFTPSLHLLEVRDRTKLWEPPPLPVYRPLREVELRVVPTAERLQLEKRDETLVPAGKDSKLLLEAQPKAPSRAFQAKPVKIILNSPGYLPKRVSASADIWSSEIYPPPSEEPIVLDKAPGWSAWWIRTKKESLLGFGIGLLVFLGLVVLVRLRYHYLRQIELAHGDLKLWMERLTTFVDGSQSLAAPLSVEELADCAVVQARRLTRCDEAVLCLIEPEYQTAVQYSDEAHSALDEICKHVATKGYPLRIDDLKNGSWSALSSHFSSALAVPLAFKSVHRGALVTLGKSLAQFSETDQEALLVLAFQLAGGVERSRLHQETVTAYEKLAESEAQLVQSAKLSAVGQLAAGVAHELNTPLNAISVGVEMGQKFMDQDPKKAKRRLELAVAAIDKAEKIVGKLLYYSREARMEVKVQPITELIDDTLDFISFQLNQDSIELVREEEAALDVECNPNELSQVLNNLILNAREAILSGDFPKKIRINTRSIEDEQVEIRVTDHGPGVPDDIAAKIFDPFFTTKNMGGASGTGLGLSVSSKIVERHSGLLKLEPGEEGTTFVVTLPCRLPKEDQRR